MPSVTQIVGTAHQPRKGYLPLSKFDMTEYRDGRSVSGEYNIHPAIVGLAVDYGTRLAQGAPSREVFSVALAGASLVGALNEAEELLGELDDIAGEDGMLSSGSIVRICKLSGFDSAFRAGARAYKPVSEIEPDDQTVADIRTLIERTVAFFEENGPVIDSGFTFSGGYSDSIESGDADYLTADTIWDLKVRKAQPNKNSTLQVLLYYLLSLHSDQPEFKGITKVGIYNPYLQCAWTVSVLDLDESMLREVEVEVLGLQGRHYPDAAQLRYDQTSSRTIYHVIDWIRETSESERDKGDKFERATRFFLEHDPVYSQRFSKVWMWKDAPTNDGIDMGIDLVALDAEDGSYWAIQCKCYQKPALDYNDVATFYGKTGATDQYKHNMIVTTCADFGPNLNKIAKQWDTVRLFADGMADSEVDWDAFMEGRETAERKFKEPLPHQREAIDACLEGFEESERGQLIMACGTGKTLTSLRLTEELLPEGSTVLFLAPSIALVAQTMREWANQSKRAMRCAVVCSDAKASSTEGDTWETSLSDIPYPATTDPENLYEQVRRFDKGSGINVVFSTYQSIQVVSDAQRMGLDPFDLIVSDEAHRTTGASEAADDLKKQSEFTKVHDNRLVSAHRRIYMTATPKLYGDNARRQAKTENYEISSMDDEAKFGPVFYRLTFGRAVDEGLLTDYRVIALTVSEDVVSDVYQMAMASEEGFEITDAAKVIGCWKGLADQGKGDEGVSLKNAVAFCSTIPESKRMTDYFQRTVNAYIDYENEQGNDVPLLECVVDHVDGTMDMGLRKEKLRWLADVDDPDEDGGECHVLSNVHCLSEGVDVPNLDAIMFLQPKKSRIEVVQAVGRVMRRFEGKEYGYIILPVVIPAGMTPEEALDNTDAFKVVWEIVQALRSHDERLDGSINGLEYDPATTAVVDVINVSKDSQKPPTATGEGKGALPPELDGEGQQMKLDFSDKELQEAVNAVLVRKCGTKVYWEDWAKDIGQIAKRHIERVGELVLDGGPASAEFASFLKGLRDSLNQGITEDEAVEMLAQHMITLPVFEALFAGAEFASSNPVSIAMEGMVETLRGYGIETDSERRELAELYSSVRLRAEGVRTDGGRQKIIKELYEKFFSQAFKATSEKMGIVYTPNEVVDYILHATDRLMRKEFGQSLADPGVNILDPFTGTGTFVVNLIQDEELMPDDKLPLKYEREIFCNEILLLAYYIATINIEHAYHSRIPGDYAPFEGAVLTDTFQMYEEGDPIDLGTFVDNTERILREMETPINVIIGNPPYSAGQKNENDNAKNLAYPTLDDKIRATYADRSSATLKTKLYDSYIRAFRWASDRIGNKGVISFVTNGGWLEGGSMDGFRKSLVDEFSSIYVFNLRGNQYSQGEQSRKEGGKIFGSGSRATIVITMLVKNPDSDEHGAIHYHDIGDYLTRDEKLSIVREAVLGEAFEWETLLPDRHGDWLNQRDDSWYEFAPMAIDKHGAPGIFGTYSLGVLTARDAWAYNYSKEKVSSNIERLVEVYNSELERYEEAGCPKDVSSFVDSDATRISWTGNLKGDIKRQKLLSFSPNSIVRSSYRPFCKQWAYFDRRLNERVYLMPEQYPDKDTQNISICISGTKNFSALITDELPNYHFDGDSQCFPMYWYERTQEIGGLFQGAPSELIQHEAVSNEALTVFREAYPRAFDAFGKRKPRPKSQGGIELTKEDIFYYVYGILHSPEYRERFDSNLKKELPRIPLAEDFVAFSNAGRNLAKLHLGYEDLEPWPVEEVGNSVDPGPVKKIKWAKKRNPSTGKKENDYTTLIYNDSLTIRDIPSGAQRYVVNGRSPLDWVIDRYQVKTDGPSGITNDPNDYSEDPRYIVDLIEKLVRVSMETMEIVDSLPALKEKPQPADWPLAWRTEG